MRRHSVSFDDRASNSVSVRRGVVGGAEGQQQQQHQQSSLSASPMELAADGRFVQKLFRKIQKALTHRSEAYGVVEINSVFRKLDVALTRESHDERERSLLKQQYSSKRGGGEGGALGANASSSYRDPYAHHYEHFLHQSAAATLAASASPASASTLAFTDENTFIRYIYDGLSMEGVTLKEVQVLFVLLDTDEDGFVDMADALLAIRKLFRCTAQQFHEVLKKIRCRRPPLHPSGSGGGSEGPPEAEYTSLHQQRANRCAAVGGSAASRRNNHGHTCISPPIPNPFRRLNGSSPSRPPTREQVFDFLIGGRGISGPFGLTESEAYLFLDYCSVQEKDGGRVGGGEGSQSMDRNDYFTNSGLPTTNPNASVGQQPQQQYPYTLSTRHLGELDLEYIETVIFSDTLPDDVAFPLVMAKLVESATDAAKGEKSGTSGMLRALRQCSLVHNPNYEVPQRRQQHGVTPLRNGVLPAGVATGTHRGDSTFGIGQAGGDSPEARQQQGARVNNLRTTHFTNGPRGGEGTADDDDDVDDETAKLRDAAKNNIMAKCLDMTNFRKFLHIFQGGLPVGECDLLFGYLCDTTSQLLSVETLINQFRERVDVWSGVDMMLTLEAIRSRVNLLQLHILLTSQFGCYTEIPLENFTIALRRCGVSIGLVSDIELEHVYRETRTAAALVLLVRGPIPRPREHTIEKLFARLDEGGVGSIPMDLMLRAFDPSQPANARHAVVLQQQMYSYLMSMARNQEFGVGGGGGGARAGSEDRANSDPFSSPSSNLHISYAEFTYFWGCVSLGFDADADFSLFLWKAYRCQDDKKSGYSGVIPSRRAPIPLARLVAEGVGMVGGAGGGGGGGGSIDGMAANINGYRSASVASHANSASFYVGGGANHFNSGSAARCRGVSTASSSAFGGGALSGGAYYSGIIPSSAASPSLARGGGGGASVRRGGSVGASTTLGGFSRNVSQFTEGGGGGVRRGR